MNAIHDAYKAHCALYEAYTKWSSKYREWIGIHERMLQAEEELSEAYKQWHKPHNDLDGAYNRYCMAHAALCKAYQWLEEPRQRMCAAYQKWRQTYTPWYESENDADAPCEVLFLEMRPWRFDGLRKDEDEEDVWYVVTSS